MEAVILCGGLGTRLRSVVADRPKSLAQIGDKPFLDYLVTLLRENGVRRIVLLTGYGSELIEEWVESNTSSIDFVVSRENVPLGTGGALLNAWNNLGEEFLLFNGDTFFDVQLKILKEFVQSSGAEAVVALRFSESVERYGSVEVSSDDCVVSFIEKGKLSPGFADAYINGGIYYFRKTALEAYFRKWGGQAMSLERDILPALVAEGRLRALPMGGLFVDIGVPSELTRAQVLIPNRLSERRRDATFVDRDGVLVRDTGYPAGDAIQVIDPGRRIVREARDQGRLVIVVTNQAGIAKGKFTLEDYERGMKKMCETYARDGLSFDGIYFCPFHTDGVVKEYRKRSLCRKPKPGMILKACEDFRIDLASSIMIGNRDTDRIELYGLNSVMVST